MRYVINVSTGQTEELPDLPPEPVVVTIPARVTMRQARLALHQAGKLSLVDPLIESLPEPLKTTARIEWEYSSAVLRHNGIVSQVAPLLGISEAEIDQLFIAAEGL